MMQTKRHREHRSLLRASARLAAARDALIRMGLLKEDQRQDDPKALQRAVLRVPYQAEEDLVMRNAGDPDNAQDGVTRNGKGAADVCSISFQRWQPPRGGRMSRRGVPPLFEMPHRGVH
jgi:hypothetical protein